MSVKVSPLNYADHGHLKIKAINNYEHVNAQQVLPVVVHEFSAAAAEMPVVFVKNAETGEFQSVAILGFKPGENLFYNENKWQGTYIPAYATHHPFALIPSENDENQLRVAFSESSLLVSEKEGNALFDDKGNETEYMENRKKALGNYYENTHVTKVFTKVLTDMALLVEQSLSLELNGEKMNISGVYLINETKLNELSDVNFLELRKKGFLSPIYSHMGSLRQLKNLAQLKTAK